jgi:SWI/SNF-related matrix-associated actin-dependent regulator of chromatin subfamily B protein 1
MAAQPSTAAVAGSSATADDSNPSGNSASPSVNAADAATEIPVRTKESFTKLVIEQYMMHDAVAAMALTDQLQQTREHTATMRGKVQDYKAIRNEYRQWFPPSRLYGEGYSGFANGFTDNPHQASRIVYPTQKPRPGRQVPALRYKRKDMLKQAEQHEELVPVRLEVEWDKIKLRDTFTWNLHDRLIHIDLFAMQLVEDMGLKPPAFQPVFEQVVQQIREQLNDFYPFAFSEEDALDPELPYSAYKNDEMRILIKLNITIGQHTLVDQFEWEINNPLNSPEEFAANMARDMSLSGEFTTAIAHCIREQSQLFTRSLYSVGHPFDGRPIEDPDLVMAFLQSPLPTVFRPQQQAKDYQPYLYEMTDTDLERNETILSREQRRQKRSINRRGGPQLPDLKERQRTIRTLLVSQVVPGGAPNMDESGLYKRPAGAGKKRVTKDGDISESEESDDSTPDSPAPSHLAQGTARTRGMRGAASAAQQRMANLGRSETPESSSLSHHHETRTSRRFREETEEPTHLWVKLKVNREKLRPLMNGDYRDIAASSQPPTPSSTPRAAPGASSNAKSMPPPPSTPSNGTPQPASGSQYSFPAGQIGRVPAPPLVPGQEPPPSVSLRRVPPTPGCTIRHVCSRDG